MIPKSLKLVPSSTKALLSTSEKVVYKGSGEPTLSGLETTKSKNNIWLSLKYLTSLVMEPEFFWVLAILLWLLTIIRPFLTT